MDLATTGPRVCCRCDICGRKQRNLMGMFAPNTGEKIYICSGQCSTDLIRAQEKICAKCNYLSNFSPIYSNMLRDDNCGDCKFGYGIK